MHHPTLPLDKIFTLCSPSHNVPKGLSNLSPDEKIAMHGYFRLVALPISGRNKSDQHTSDLTDLLFVQTLAGQKSCMGPIHMELSDGVTIQLYGGRIRFCRHCIVWTGLRTLSDCYSPGFI